MLCSFLPRVRRRVATTVADVRYGCTVHHHCSHQRRHYLAVHSKRFSSARTVDTCNNNNNILPVGIFVDLDNVGPLLYGRSDAQAFVQPFVQFVTAMGLTGQQEAYHSGRQKDHHHNNNHNQRATITTFQAFGNRATQTYISPEERAAPFDQTWQFSSKKTYQNKSTTTSAATAAVAITGYDAKDGTTLRCGICGARMNLTKKNKAAGMTVERKLKKHMAQLHDREQAKRINRYLKGNNNKKKNKNKRKPRMPQPELEKYLKYKSAQIGLSRLGSKKKNRANSQQPPSGYRSSRSNELFLVLAEQGVRCYSAQDVDKTLSRHAMRWMDRVAKQQRQQQQRQQEQSHDSHSMEDCTTIDSATNATATTPTKVGFLIVASEDADFVPLLQRAGSKKFWAISATPQCVEQTRKLGNVSDMILRRKQSYSPIDEYYPSFGPYVIEPRSKEAHQLLQQLNLGGGVGGNDDQHAKNRSWNDDNNDEDASDDDYESTSYDEESDETTSHDSESDEIQSSDQDENDDPDDNDNDEMEYRGESIPAHLRPLLNVKIAPSQSMVETMSEHSVVATSDPVINRMNNELKQE